MIDIGASIGVTAIPRVVLGDCQVVYAAEPAPDNYRALVRNVVRNGLAGFVLPDHLAIGARDEDRDLAVGTSLAYHSLAPDDASPYRDPEAGTIRVRCRSLDGWLAGLGVDPREIGFIKVDTQGWEGHVFQGAARTLAHRQIAWQIEVWPEGLALAGYPFGDLIAQIQAHFSHFIDLRSRIGGARVRPVADLAAALAYFASHPTTSTDLLLFNGPPA